MALHYDKNPLQGKRSEAGFTLNFFEMWTSVRADFSSWQGEVPQACLYLEEVLYKIRMGTGLPQSASLTAPSEREPFGVAVPAAKHGFAL